MKPASIYIGLYLEIALNDVLLTSRGCDMIFAETAFHGLSGTPSQFRCGLELPDIC